jgi:hypothetical protein
MPFLGALTCSEHKCRCAKLLAPPAPVEAPLTDDWREKVLADVVLAAREAYAQNKGLWFFADELERMSKGGAK